MFVKATTLPKKCLLNCRYILWPACSSAGFHHKCLWVWL